jgi:hypothetical protein
MYKILRQQALLTQSLSADYYARAIFVIEDRFIAQGNVNQ